MDCNLGAAPMFANCQRVNAISLKNISDTIGGKNNTQVVTIVLIKWKGNLEKITYNADKSRIIKY